MKAFESFLRYPLQPRQSLGGDEDQSCCQSSDDAGLQADIEQVAEHVDTKGLVVEHRPARDVVVYAGFLAFPGLPLQDLARGYLAASCNVLLDYLPVGNNEVDNLVVSCGPRTGDRVILQILRGARVQ